MIERHWKGVAKFEEADNYIDHLVNDTFPKLKTIEGFGGASILKRSVDRGIEFLVVTVWKSLESISQFAGAQIDVAVVPDLVRSMMVEYDEHVLHFDVVRTESDDQMKPDKIERSIVQD